MNKLVSISLLLQAMILGACADTSVASAQRCEAAFFKLVDEGRVQSINGLAIAPDYKAYYYTEWVGEKATIQFSKCDGVNFSASKALYPVDGYQDYQPVLSAGGKRLYFTSTRPIEGNEPIRQNVWVADKADDFQNPSPIHSLVSSLWDGHAVEISSEELLFASARGEADTMVDIYRVDLSLEEAIPAPVVMLNSTSSDNDMAYNHSSGLLVFSRYDPQTKDIDLFASRKLRDGWVSPIAVEFVNTGQWEMSPAMTPDGEYFLFKRGEEAFQRLPLSDIERLVANHNL